MADKRQVKKSIKRLQRVKTWQLFIVLILVGFIAATLLRLDNVGMVQLRSAVLATDKAGDETATTNNLVTLQHYAATHMNANTGQFYLQGEYTRASQAAVNAVNTSANPYGDIYLKADETCKPQFTHYSQAYYQCFTSEVDKYPPAPNLSDRVQLPDPSLFAHSYISPGWYPDFAGLAVGLCVLIVLIILARLASLGVLYLLLKRQYKTI